MGDEEAEYEQETESRQVTGFEKLDETEALIESLLSVPLSVEPSPEEDKIEVDHLLALHRIVRDYIRMSSPLLTACVFLAGILSRTVLPAGSVP